MSKNELHFHTYKTKMIIPSTESTNIIYYQLCYIFFQTNKQII